MHARRLRVFAALAATLGLTLAGCATTTSGSSSDSGGGSTGGTLTVGTTDQVTSIDPAGNYDQGSFFVEQQVYPFLLSSVPGSSDATPKPDIAESASFTTPTTYTVKLKPGLKFANGHDLTSTDVKFSFDRQVAINDPNGPASLLVNLASTAAPDPTTVVFTLKAANDQTWPGVLTTPAGPIVDHQVFPAEKIMPDADIAAAHPFAGQYDIASYSVNELVSFKKNPHYGGSLGAVKNQTVNLKYYTTPSNMKIDIEKGNIDVVYRSLSATDIDSLHSNSQLAVHEGPGGEIRYIVFNLNTMPYGAKTSNPDTAKALAVRQAMADLIDRSALSTQVYKGTYAPLYGYIPDGLMGAGTPLKAAYGDGNGGPSLDKAKQKLNAVGITSPVQLNIQYTTKHYGPSAGDEYALIKSQLENGGLFTVNLQSTEWVQYSKDRSADVYPIYQLGWFPDYSDPDDYLTPFFTSGNFLANHYDNSAVQSLITQEATQSDATKRAGIVDQLQTKLGADLSTLPLMQGKQIVVADKSVQGVTLDASYKFLLAPLNK